MLRHTFAHTWLNEGGNEGRPHAHHRLESRRHSHPLRRLSRRLARPRVPPPHGSRRPSLALARGIGLANPTTQAWLLWIDQEILDRHLVGSYSMFTSKEPMLRAYEIHSHAEELLRRARSQLDRVDAVTTLKRAVDQRLRRIDELYDLRSIPIRDKPQKLLDILEYFGVARPLMVRELLAIRNAVEHHDEPPPDMAELNRFVDLVWCFLRSTDINADRVTEHMGFDESDDHRGLGFEIEVKPPDWSFSFAGWLAPWHVSEVQIDGWAIAHGVIEDVEPQWDLTGRETTDLRVKAELRGLVKCSVVWPRACCTPLSSSDLSVLRSQVRSLRWKPSS
jgi:hypothetical protein